MDKEKTVNTAAEPGTKKKGGRKPMTAEGKAAAAKGYPSKDNNKIIVQSTAKCGS